MLNSYFKTYTKRLLSTFACLVLLISFISTYASTADTWQSMFLKDLAFIERTLESQSAPGRNTEDIAFQSWLHAGIEQTKAYVKHVKNEKAYRALLKYYVYGFRRDHLDIDFFDETLQDYSFPGFFLKQCGEKYCIGYVEENLPQTLLGKRVVAIDDKEIEAHIGDIVSYSFSINDKTEIKRCVPYILIDEGSPLIKRPRSITVINHKQELERIALRWQPIQKKHSPIARTLAFRSRPQMQSHPFCGGIWISIPTFAPSEEQKVLFEAIFKNIASYRDMPFIIIDLRGNGGGGSIWQRPFIRNLYGDSLLKSLGKKHSYNTQWSKKYIQENGDKTVSWSIFEEGEENLYSNEDSVDNFPPIVLLTDVRCASTCWLFVREMLQIPNVIQIGDSTAAQSLYSESQWITLPSGKGQIYVPKMQRIHPLDNIDKPFHPTYKFQGDWNNEEELKHWVTSILEQLHLLSPNITQADPTNPTN